MKILLSEQLRESLINELNGKWSRVTCEACGQTIRHSLRTISKEIGISPATLSRFARGKAIDSNTVDKLFKRYFV